MKAPAHVDCVVRVFSRQLFRLFFREAAYMAFNSPAVNTILFFGNYVKVKKAIDGRRQGEADEGS